MSAIDTYLGFIANEPYARNVRTAIVNAIRECYSNTQNPSLREEAFIAAIEAELQNGHLTGLDLGDGDVTTSKIANGAVTREKLDPNITFDADPTLDETSTNAIQNKAVASAISELNGSLANLPYVEVKAPSEMTNKKLIYKYVDALWFWTGMEWRPTWKHTSQNLMEIADLYDLLSVCELKDMKKSNRRITVSGESGVEGSYNGSSIHFFNFEDSGYERVKIRGTGWGYFYYYNPNDETYTLLIKASGSTTPYLLDSIRIPDGCYLCFSCPDSVWKSGQYKFLARFWINPNYTNKFENLDESICDISNPISVELLPIEWSVGYTYYYINTDMRKYKDCVIRILNNTTRTFNVSFGVAEVLTSYKSINLTVGSFEPWIYDGQYLTFYDRENSYFTYGYDISIGWINPVKAIEQKRARYWGADIMSHNADDRKLLTMCCVFSDLIDLDVCRTLDGYYVCIHAETINNKSITGNNLEDLALTENQMEVMDALRIMQKYNSYCYFNFRGTTTEQKAELIERGYAMIGRQCVHDTDVFTVHGDPDPPIYGHLGKYYVIASVKPIDDLVAAGADVHKILKGKLATSNTYNYLDWINCIVLNSVSSADDIPKDGSASLVLISENMTNVLNG